MRYICAPLDQKPNLLEILEKIFKKISKFFLRKLIKMLYFNIFLKDLANPALNICTFGRQTICLKSARKISEIFQNFSLEN